ncbi:MAG TPA: proline dehydrogenase family protein [Actinomycetota bacterium]|jgi:proline dehydrogenase|nr:proline dehydrogenase family protein [Actinomycetota bacterium]
MNPVKAALLWASQSAALSTRLPRMRFVQRSVSRFMPGESAEEALAAAERMARGSGVAASFTRLGENTTDLAVAAEAAGDYLRLLDRIEELGLDAEVSVKLTQLGFDIDPAVTATHVQRLVDRSAELGRTCWIDIESAPYVDGTIDLYERQVRRSRHVGLCLQAYLRRTYDDVQRLLPASPSIRLVKGAYREPADLVFTSKAAIDESFFRLAQHLADGGCHRLVLGSHDTDLIARIEGALGGHDAFEVAMLYGIRSDEQRRLAAEGYDVRTLISYGPSWYPWFMRRLAEKPVENSLLALRNLF